MIEDCEQLMEEADEFDMIHDVIIKVINISNATLTIGAMKMYGK